MIEKYLHLVLFCGALLYGNNAISQTASDDAATTMEDMPIIINVIQNDTFGDYGPGAVPIMLYQQPVNGSAEVITNGTPEDPTDDTILYTPNNAFYGDDSFVYVIYDSIGNSSSATVFVTVGSCSAAIATATDDTYSTDFETQVVCGVLSNDILNSGVASNLIVSAAPAHGTTTVVTYQTNNAADDQIIYTPDSGFTGTDTFQYSITDCSGATVTANVFINVINTLQTADDHGSVSQFVSGNIVIANILNNDTIGGNTASTATVAITQLSTTNPNFNIDTATGAAILEPGTPSQHYVITYQICEIAHPGNCATGKVVLLSAQSDFENQELLVSPCHVIFTDNVFSNDSYYGQPIIYGEENVNNNNVTVNMSSASGQVHTEMPISGIVMLYNIANEDTTDTITYQVCDAVRPEICDQATFTVTIDNHTMFAYDDDFSGTPVNNLTESDTPQSVFSNDLNCTNPLDIGSFYASATNFPEGISLNTDGTIHVTAGVVPDTYLLNYAICSNQWNDCSTAQATIIVEGDLKTPDFIFRDISVAPNPVSGILTVSGVENIDSITILSVLGQELTVVKGSAPNEKVNFSNFASGIYVVKVKSGGVEKTFKIVKN